MHNHIYCPSVAQHAIPLRVTYAFRMFSIIVFDFSVSKHFVKITSTPDFHWLEWLGVILRKLDVASHIVSFAGAIRIRMFLAYFYDNVHFKRLSSLV
jgi:hypothetical protein